MWRSAFEPLWQDSMTEHADWLGTAFSVQFTVRDLLAEAWFSEYALQFAKPLLDTSATELGAVLQQAQAEGWSIATAQAHITTLFRQWMVGDIAPSQWEWAAQRLPPHRAEMIARTESIRASNWSSLQTFRAWGAPGKQWLATLDGRERESHHAVNGQKVATGATFLVGGVAMQGPHDPAAPASQVANCRCVLLPILDASELPSSMASL